MNPQFQHTKVFHDWDYQADFCPIHKVNSSSSASCDNTDLLSFEDNNTFVSDLTSSRPPSSNSFLDEGPIKTSYSHAETVHSDPSVAVSTTRSRSSNSDSSVYVVVSGTSFAVPRDAFHKIQKLPWQCDQDGVLHIHTSPAIFEVLLSHVVFETLPAYDTFSKPEYEEFEPMALCLGLNDLVEHFGRSSERKLRSRIGRRRSSILKKNHKANHIILNNENADSASSKIMAANGKAARFVASITRQARNSLNNKRVKATHDQLCASDHIN